MPGRRYCASKNKQTKNRQNSVVRVCEFVDRVSQIRVLGYFSRVFFSFFLFFSPFSFFFFFFFSPFFFFLSPFLFFIILFYIALPILWIESASLRSCLVGLLVGHVVDVSEDIKADGSSRGLDSHASSFLDTNSSVRLSRISVFMQWWNVNAVLDSTGTFVFANSHVCIDSFCCCLRAFLT